MKNEKLQIGMIGLGGISSAHLAGYLAKPSDVAVVAVCDTRPDVLEATATKLGATPYADYDELISDSRVHAVDITLPHNLHYRVALKALDAGKHVIVEKPIAPTAKQCSELIARAAEKGVVFTAAENTPFVTAYRYVEQLLERETVGKLRMVRTFIYGSEVSRLTNTSLWKGKRDGSNGGAIMDAGPHSFYLIKWLFGEFDSLQATCWKLVEESEVEDNAVVCGRLQNGGLFVSEFSFTAEIPWGERFEVYGDKGSIIVDQLVDPPIKVYRGKDNYDSEPVTEAKYDPRGWKFESIGAGVRDFASAIRERREPRVNPLDATYGVYIAEKAYESIELGGKSIEV